MRAARQLDAGWPLAGLLGSAVDGAAESALTDAALQADRVMGRALQFLGRRLSPLERFAVLMQLAGAAVQPAAPLAPILVNDDRALVAGEWVVVDATESDVVLTVPVSTPGDEIRVRRADASSTTTVQLSGAFSWALGPGHAVLLKGEADGAWGLW